MKLYEKQLGAGITFRAIPKEGLKTDYLLLSFRAPLTKENAVLQAMLPPVLGRGCEKYPDLETLSEHLDTLYYAYAGCRTARLGETETLQFSVRALETACVPEHEDVFLGALETLAELALHPLIENGGFRASYVETEKKNAVDAIRSRISNKEAYAAMRCTEEMCRDEAYAFGCFREEDVLAVTPEALYRAYREMLAYAPADIFYVGKRDPGELAHRFSECFAPLLAGRKTPLWETGTEVLRRAAHPVRYVDEDQPAHQGKLQIGFRSGSVLSDGDYYVTVLFNELFGGSASSRLFLRVREAMGLCYYCSSAEDPYKGLTFVACGVSGGNRKAAEEAIFSELADIAAGNISDAEFDAAKKSVYAGYMAIEDSNSSLAQWYYNRILAGIDTSPAETAAQVLSVTKEQTAAAAARLTADTVYYMNGTLPDDENGCGGEAFDDDDL